MQKTKVEPADVIEALADKEGNCRWLILKLSPVLIGAVSAVPSPRMMTQPIKEGYDPNRDPGNYSGLHSLTQILKADGLVRCTARARDQEGLDELLKELHLTHENLVEVYSQVPELEKSHLEDQMDETASSDDDNSDAPRG